MTQITVALLYVAGGCLYAISVAAYIRFMATQRKETALRGPCLAGGRRRQEMPLVLDQIEATLSMPGWDDLRVGQLIVNALTTDTGSAVDQRLFYIENKDLADVLRQHRDSLS